MSGVLTVGQVLQALGIAALSSIPFLGVRATADPDDGRRSRISPVRSRLRAVWRSGPARVGRPGQFPPALAPRLRRARRAPDRRARRRQSERGRG